MNRHDNENSNSDNIGIWTGSAKGIIFMGVGSVVAILGIVLISPILIPVFFINLILIPVLFAYPIIKQRLEMLFIPTILFTGAVVVFYGFLYAPLIPYVLFIIAVIAVFGVVAGIFINKLKGSTKKRNVIVKAVGAVFLLIPFLFVANYLFLGNPIGSLRARGRIRTYVNKHFTDFDFIVGLPRFHFSFSGDFRYIATVYARGNRNKYFEVTHFPRFGGVDFTYNSRHFRAGYSNVLRYLISPLVENRFGDSIERIWVSRSGSTLTSQYRFEIELKVDCLKPHTLSEIIMYCRDVIVQNEIPITLFNFRFISGEKEMQISNLRTRHINRNLLLTIETIQESFGTRGQANLTGYPPVFYRFEHISN